MLPVTGHITQCKHNASSDIAVLMHILHFVTFFTLFVFHLQVDVSSAHCCWMLVYF